jgi:hypothetical protein
MIHLGSRILNKALLLYQELSDCTNILRAVVKLYKAWNKLEKVKKWLAKLPHMENNKSV